MIPRRGLGSHSGRDLGAGGRPGALEERPVLGQGTPSPEAGGQGAQGGLEEASGQLAARSRGRRREAAVARGELQTEGCARRAAEKTKPLRTPTPLHV